MKEMDLILIHSNKLNLTAATLSTLHSLPAPAVMHAQTLNKTRYMVFHLSQKLKAGFFYTLHTQFAGELANDLGGYYKSKYYVSQVKQ